MGVGFLLGLRLYSVLGGFLRFCVSYESVRLWFHMAGGIKSKNRRGFIAVDDT
ncbi:MAG: hypothetical protein QXH35_05435 [Nitrososphaerota archaeon]